LYPPCTPGRCALVCICLVIPTLYPRTMRTGLYMSCSAPHTFHRCTYSRGCCGRGGFGKCESAIARKCGSGR
jgi:hypothetical protein